MANKGNALLDGSNNALAIANGGTGAITQTAAFDALSPATTKGDLITHNGTNNIRLATGISGQMLVTDSTTTEGIKWSTI